MGKLFVLMITAFVDMVGLLMIIPLLPFYAKDLGANGFIVGLLVSSFAIAQLITAPVWGRFSDRYGRRPALLVGLTASAIAYVVFAYANVLWLLFLSRLVQGAGGGTVSVIQAYVADALRPEERAKGLGWLSAATNAGVALGPVLGPVASHWGRSGPGLAAAALCVINIAFAWYFLSESRDMVEAKATGRTRSRSRDALSHVVTHSSEPASRLIWIYAIAMGAFQGAMTILALFLSVRFGVTAKNIGFFFTYIGTISVLTRALILGWAVDRFGEARLSRFGSMLLAIGLAAIAFMYPLRDPAAVAHKLDLSVSFVAV
ncbi:MAG TPA: MFS transporter, partial [Gemmatimonadaceae bacterium]|nr:MFS transporter [Gemmatimonadaceae bacterium]